MGDVAGDAKMEIVAADREAVYAWTFDGKSVLGGDGIFKSRHRAGQRVADAGGSRWRRQSRDHRL